MGKAISLKAIKSELPWDENEEIEDIEVVSEVRVLMKEEPVSYDLDHSFNSKDKGAESINLF